MVVFTNLEDMRFDGQLVLAIGTFDGVHRGHQYLLEQARARAREHGLAFGIITFDPAPALVLRPETTDYQITPRELKIQLLSALRPDLLAVIPFTREFSMLTAKQFVDILERCLRLAELWMGDDFRFGHDREGGIPYLLERARHAEFAVHVVARQGAQAGAAGVSSTAVREAIRAGEMEHATELLGRYFELSGIVVHGHARGRALGYPTANLQIPSQQIKPASGVYAGIAELPGEQFAAAISVGTNPHFDGSETTVEAYLLDFDRDIYDQVLNLKFVRRLREQARFETLAALLDQIATDVERTREAIQPLLAR